MKRRPTWGKILILTQNQGTQSLAQEGKARPHGLVDPAPLVQVDEFDEAQVSLADLEPPGGPVEYLIRRRLNVPGEDYDSSDPLEPPPEGPDAAPQDSFPTTSGVAVGVEKGHRRPFLDLEFSVLPAPKFKVSKGREEAEHHEQGQGGRKGPDEGRRQDRQQRAPGRSVDHFHPGYRL